MSPITAIIIALPLLLACGALIVGYVLWRGRRRTEDAEIQAQSSGGGGGPKEPA